MSDLAAGLHDVFIIETSGILIFEQEFMPLPKPLNKDMIGGFLTAIDAFTAEMTGQKIQVIQLETMSVHYTNTGKLYFVVIVANDVDVARIHTFLSHIQQRFEGMYGDYIEKGDFSNVSKFDAFATELEKEVGKASKHHTIFSEPVEIVRERFEIARKRARLVHRTVSSSLDNLGHLPRMPKLTAPGHYRGARGSKRGPAPSACGLGDVAARRRSAGYRPSRSRAAVPRAAKAWCPCPGTRHDVPLARCCRGDAELRSPRRRSRLTSARVAGRAGA
nr:hypothetical protein [Candidatus Sigynarchaeum springense]